MPTATRQAISSSSLLSLALPAALFASFAQASLHEQTLARLEDQARPAIHQASEQAPRDHWDDALLLEVHTQASENEAGRAIVAEPSTAIADNDHSIAQPAAHEPPQGAQSGTSSEHLQRVATSGAAGRTAPISSLIVSAEPSAGGRQTSHDFKALGVPVPRSTPRSPGDHTHGARAGNGDRPRERKVDLKYVARSDATRHTGDSLSSSVHRDRLDRSAEPSRQLA